MTEALGALRRADEGRKAVIEQYEHLLSRELRNEDGTVELEAIITLQPAGALSAQTLLQANVRRVELDVREANIDFGSVDAWEPDYEE